MSKIKIQDLLNKCKAGTVVNSINRHLTKKNETMNYKRLIDILSDWSVSTMVRYQIIDVVKDTLQNLKFDPNYNHGSNVDVESCRFAMQWGHAVGTYWTPNTKPKNFMDVIIYPVPANNMIDWDRPTHAVLTLIIQNNRIVDAKYKHVVARCPIEDIYFEETNEYGHPQMYLQDSGGKVAVCASCKCCMMPNRGQGTACDNCQHDFLRECEADYADGNGVW